jgi:hypothetical protein
MQLMGAHGGVGRAADDVAVNAEAALQLAVP